VDNHKNRLRKKQLFSIECKIKNLILDLCYIKLNEFIQNKYHNNYLLSNFSMNIDISKNLCNAIYFNYFIEDYCKNKIDMPGGNPPPDYTYVNPSTIATFCLTTNLIQQTYCTQPIANIRVNGELNYGCDLKKNN